VVVTGDPVILVGAAAFAEEITDLCRMAGVGVAGWIEGIDPSHVDAAADPPIVWVDDQATFEPALAVLPAIGAVARRGIVERLVGEGRSLATLVHQSAVVAPSAEIGPGCVIFPNVVIGARTRIGRGTIVNRGALIGHHTTIGAYAFVGPGANIAGRTTIGDGAYVGIGAIVRDGLSVGEGATIGAGAVAVGDVPSATTVVGVPARPIGGATG
jgi:acetyltransferase EpsM